MFTTYNLKYWKLPIKPIKAAYYELNERKICIHIAPNMFISEKEYKRRKRRFPHEMRPTYLINIQDA